VALWRYATQGVVPEGAVFEFRGGAATKPEGEEGNDGGQKRDHVCDGTAGAPKSLDFLGNSKL
jgi:hypothetical protein